MVQDMRTLMFGSPIAILIWTRLRLVTGVPRTAFA